MSQLDKIDPQEFLEKVAVEVARRFAHNLPVIGVASGKVGPPFCAVCTDVGHCAKQCPDHVAAVRSVGAAAASATDPQAWHSPQRPTHLPVSQPHSEQR